MKNKIIFILTLFIFSYKFYSQSGSFTEDNSFLKNSTKTYFSDNSNYFERETTNNWSINLLFSDNGFGVGGTKYFTLNRNLSGFTSIFFSAAKDDREFDVIDMYGNSYTPGKINRLFMIPLNIGLQYRMFREDVSDNLRPFINGGITPSAIVYTPYSKSIITSFGYAQAKYTLGGFIGVGMDYLPNKSSAVSLNIRYYYINLFGEGIQSLQNKPKNFFGGVYLVFGFNFLK